jgi:fructose-bisphosphate aldolase class II
MPVVDYTTYCRMLDSANAGNYAYPAINISSLSTANAALAGLAAEGSDGIIQVSTGGGQFASGLAAKDAVLGAIVLADAVHRLADSYDIGIALHTDHCLPDKVESFLIPLIEETESRRAAGGKNLFSSHMFDGSILALEANLAQSRTLLKRCAESEIILEVEIGVVGGEEDGVAHDVQAEKLYTTPADMVATYEALHDVGGRFLLAATFGNVHGVYKPGNVVLRPDILRRGQEAVCAAHGAEALLDLVFHGGSGSDLNDIHATLDYGVVKMNVDTDTQYAFSRPIADHMLREYTGVLKIDGEVGNKKAYDPRSYLKKGEAAMATRVARCARDLRSAGKSIIRGAAE